MWLIRCCAFVLLLAAFAAAATTSDPYQLFKQGDLRGAHEGFKKLVKKDPTDARAHFMWGNTIDSLVKNGAQGDGLSWDAAMEQHMLAAQHGHGNIKGQALVNRGVILDRLGRTHEAIEMHQSALKAYNDRNFFYPYANLGLCYERLGRSYDAVDMYEQAFKHGMPKTVAKELQFVTLLPYVYNSTQEMEYWRNRFIAGLDEMLSRDPSKIREMNDPLREMTFRNAPGYYQLGYFGYNDVVAINKLAVVIERAAPSLRYTAVSLRGNGRRNPAVKHALEEASSGLRRIRVGFLSAFLRKHASGQYIQGVITKLDPKRFEVITFHVREPYERDPRDVVANRIRSRSDKHVELPKDNLDSMRTKIENEALDILVFCELGMDPADYLLAFARLAPIQVATHGHASSSGMHDSIDYYVTYKPFERDDAQLYYTEPLVTMNGLVYYYRPELPTTVVSRQQLNLPANMHVYLCVQTLYKITPDFDPVFAGILRKDPKGVIVFKNFKASELNDLTLDRFRKLMPDVIDRILFLPSLSNEEWFSLFRIAELMIDSYPFGGYTTSLEAFSVGLPIVTLPHDMLAGRCTMAFLQAMGVGELVASDMENYVDIAVKVATDREWRDELSQRILDNNAAIFEDMTAIHDWEHFFEEAVAGKKISNLHGTEEQRRLARYQPEEAADAKKSKKEKKKRRRSSNKDEL